MSKNDRLSSTFHSITLYKNKNFLLWLVQYKFPILEFERLFSTLNFMSTAHNKPLDSHNIHFYCSIIAILLPKKLNLISYPQSIYIILCNFHLNQVCEIRFCIGLNSCTLLSHKTFTSKCSMGWNQVLYDEVQ